MPRKIAEYYMYNRLSRVHERVPIVNPPNIAQLGGILYHAPSYIRVRAIM